MFLIGRAIDTYILATLHFLSLIICVSVIGSLFILLQK